MCNKCEKELLDSLYKQNYKFEDICILVEFLDVCAMDCDNNKY